MQRVLRQHARSQRVGDFQVVDPRACPRPVTHGWSAFQTDEHRFRAVDAQRGVVARAVAQQRQAVVEPAGEGDLPVFTGRQGVAIGSENFHDQTRLQQNVTAHFRVIRGNGSGLVHGIQVEHRTAETFFQRAAQTGQERHRGGETCARTPAQRQFEQFRE